MAGEGRLGAWLDYARAWRWRVAGASLGARCRIAHGCEITRPGGLSAGVRVVLEAGAVLKLVEPGASIRLHDHVFIGRGSILDIGGQLEIGEGCLLAPGCFITDHNHGLAPDAPIWSQPCELRQVRIGAGAWLGARAVVLPGVTVGEGAVVAAGAVVTRDVEPMTIVGGVPARPLRKRIREAS